MHSKGPYRILLADDHNSIREWIRTLLEKRNDMKIVGEAADGRELVNLLASGALVPQMVVLDISMPFLHGIDAARIIKTRDPGIKVLFLTVHNDPEYVLRAQAAGAEGYVVKDNADRDLFPAIDAIRRGELYYPASAKENAPGPPAR